MEDIFLVCGLKAHRCFAQHVRRQQWWKPALPEKGVERCSIDIFRDEINDAFRLAEGQHRHHVGVFYPGHETGFRLEPFSGPFITPEFGFELF